MSLLKLLQRSDFIQIFTVKLEGSLNLLLQGQIALDGLVFVGDELHQVNGQKVHGLLAREVHIVRSPGDCSAFPLDLKFISQVSALVKGPPNTPVRFSVVTPPKPIVPAPVIQQVVAKNVLSRFDRAMPCPLKKPVCGAGCDLSRTERQPRL